MVSSHDTEVDGITAFSTSPATSYRYILRLKDDKLSIWMEDRTCKKQWSKSGMIKEDYVTSANAIADASAIDYLKLFQDALDGEPDESGDAHCTLEMLSGDACQLVVSVKFRILRSVRVVKYTFVLEPVSVERIDVLKSKMRDQQEELKRVQQKCATHIHLEALTKNDKTNKLQWSDPDSYNFALDHETGEILIHRPGVYSVTIVVKTGTNQTVYFWKNVEDIFSVKLSSIFSFKAACTIVCFHANDRLSVTVDLWTTGPCNLLIEQIGR
uniref:GOLD domain-containing protein n=1 Tax=Peronospora matthiolae TaxID=2874970 RepID=A0AAV1TBT0_9STRA